MRVNAFKQMRVNACNQMRVNACKCLKMPKDTMRSFLRGHSNKTKYANTEERAS